MSELQSKKVFSFIIKLMIIMFFADIAVFFSAYHWVFKDSSIMGIFVFLVVTVLTIQAVLIAIILYVKKKLTG